MTRERTDSKTDANLLVARAGEADANRRYLAYGIQALNEDRPDIAQLFFEAAGAEAIHPLNHLRTMGAIATTRENLQTAATGEMVEIEVVLPRMIREAEEDGRADAAASFRLALERERHHREMFRTALETFDRAPAARLPPRVPPRAERGLRTASEPVRAAERVPGHARTDELAGEAERIGRLSSIREGVFGAQDGLVSTFAV